MKISKNVSSFLIILAILGVIVFCVKSWVYANSHVSVGDEGSYLYKGYMFARGDYYPFQEYAFWTNKAPLSFVIPGYIQLWFGPGLREGRYFALAVSLFMLAGIWIVANRLGGKGWAAFAVWVFALSNEQIMVLSQALSQGLVACMLTWMFVSVLGEKRSLWQLLVGSILSVLVIMTRQNMLPVPFFLIAYIFWQYGRKAGLLSLGMAILVFLGFYLFYGPQLLNLWLEWIPNLQTPFDKVISNSPDSYTAFTIDRIPARIQSFALNIHDHLLIMMGTVSALILWPSKASWKNNSQFTMAVFLAANFFIIFAMHVWASIFNNYCVWCLPAYQVFYNAAGLLLIILVFSNKMNSSKPRQYTLFVYLVFISMNIGLHYYREWSGWLLNKVPVLLVGSLLSEGRFSTVPLTELLTRQFSLSVNAQERLVSAAGGVFIGIVLVAAAWMLHNSAVWKKWTGKYSMTATALMLFTVIGMIFPLWLDRSTSGGGCSNDFLTYYENTGRKMAGLVPGDDLVYWQGSGRHLALMLYLDDVRIFPPQIHAGGGNYSTDDQDVDELLKIGRFNKVIDSQWREQADFFFIWDVYFTKEPREFFEQPVYEEVPFNMGELGLCEDNLLVFKKR